MHFFTRLVFLITILALSMTARATHLRAGYIEVKQVAPLQVIITIRAYTQTQSQVRFGGDQDILDFGVC